MTWYDLYYWIAAKPITPDEAKQVIEDYLAKKAAGG